MMKQLLMGLMLLVTAGAASAASVEWTQVGKTGDSDYDFAIFVNLSSLQIKGKYSQLSVLRELNSKQKSVGGFSYKSSIALTEYDCKNNKKRVRLFNAYTGVMGRGDLVFQKNEIGDWSDSETVKIEIPVWKIACGKK